MVLTLTMGACSKSFIDYTNPQTLPLDGTIKDLKSLTNAANGVYNNFQNVDYYNRTFTLSPELISDNVFVSRRNSNRYLNHDNFSIGNGDGYVLGAWSAMYDVVVNANLAIAHGEAVNFIPGEEQGARQVIGEMYAARALALFDLVRFFAQPYNFTADASHAGVPVITEPKNEIIAPPRETVKVVYDQIVSDLQKSLTLMTAVKKDGRFTVIAAKALLAKVYLYMEKWAEAEQLATEVIDNTTFKLLTNAQYVASWSAKFSGESLFEVANLSTDNSGSDGIGYFYEPGGYGDALATQDLYDTYTSTDVRRELIQAGTRTNAENPAYLVRKYPRGVSTRDDNIKVLRLSEVFLIRAEARAEQGKTNTAKNAGAQADLNTIIQRADPTADPVTLTGDDLVNRIILERRKELAFEGNRLFDINRKKMDLVLIQSDQTRTFTYPNNRFIMPIPFSEVNTNPNIEQNPAWK